MGKRLKIGGWDYDLPISKKDINILKDCCDSSKQRSAFGLKGQVILDTKKVDFRNDTKEDIIKLFEEMENKHKDAERVYLDWYGGPEYEIVAERKETDEEQLERLKLVK